MSNLIGQRLGQYEIIALLGKGGMGVVYRARQISVNREVAIKVISPGVVDDSEPFVERFKREAGIVAALTHPHILKLFDYGQIDETLYLAMELMLGGSLADEIKRGPMSIETVIKYVDQIASALDYAHRHKIVHRDFKPQNVLLDDEKNAYLTDFGVAKPVGAATGLTGSGSLIGTPHYMAPEQWRGEDLDGRADIYALGIALFQMLTGRIPFKAETPYELMHAHVYENPPPIHTVNTNLPPLLDAVLFKALEKDREQRFESAIDLANAFKDALNGISVTQSLAKKTLPPPTPIVQAPPPKQRNPLLIGGGIVGGILVLALLGFAARGLVGGGTPTPTLVSSTPSTAVAGRSTSSPQSVAVTATPTFVPPTPSNTVVPTQAPTLTATQTSSPTTTFTTTNTPSPVPTSFLGLSNIRVTGDSILVDVAVANLDNADTFLVEVVDDATNAILLTRSFKSPLRGTTLTIPQSIALNGRYSVQISAVDTRNVKIAIAQPLFFTYTPPTSTATLTPSATLTNAPSPSPTITLNAALPKLHGQIVYLYRTDTGQQLIMTSPDGQTITLLSDANDTVLDFSASPDGTQLAYVSNIRGNVSISIMDSDGKNVRRLTSDAYSASPIWSPDGTQIAYLSRGQSKSAIDLYNMTDINGQIRYTQLTQNGRCTSFAWSPDGTQIAYVAGGLFIYDFATGLSRQMGTEPTILSLAWSPDGKWIAYGNARSVYVVHSDGSDTLNGKQPTPAFIGKDMRWSPDGKQLLYVVGSEVTIGDPDGQNAVGLGFGLSPAWSPDGQFVVYAANTGRSLTVEARDGSVKTTINGGIHPLWIP
jgi:serine/threonine protein kinase/Tol biopolymer transport system component